MKDICSLKTIAVLFLTLFALMGIDKAISAELTETETLMFETFMKNPEARPAVRIAYWADIMTQVRNMQQDMPIRINENVYMVNVEFDGKHTIAYTYYVQDPLIDLVAVKGRLAPHLCEDPQTSLLMNVFDGEMHYTHYMYPNTDQIWGEFHMSSADCGPGF